MTFSFNDLELALFETSPSIISVEPASGSTDFALGDKITFLFDKPIRCGDNCLLYILVDNRVTELLVEVFFDF